MKYTAKEDFGNSGNLRSWVDCRPPPMLGRTSPRQCSGLTASHNTRARDSGAITFRPSSKFLPHHVSGFDRFDVPTLGTSRARFTLCEIPESSDEFFNGTYPTSEPPKIECGESIYKSFFPKIFGTKAFL